MIVDRRLVAVVVVALIGGALLCTGLAYGGYWAASLAIGGVKYAAALRPQLFWGALAAGAGAALLVTSLRLPLPTAR